MTLSSLPESTEGFVSGSHPLGPLVVILTLIHLGAGSSGSLWLKEEEKIGCVYTWRKGVVVTWCWAGVVTA